jgi:glycosyltransferase involved in cell wall biosynthesis
VVITVFNQSDTLAALLHCLNAQDVEEPFEVLICDDGSTDLALRNLKLESPLRTLDIRYIWQSKRGHRAARSKNSALRCAKGDIVVLLDGDILVKPDFLRKHRESHTCSRHLVCNPRRWVMGKRLVQRVPDGPTPVGYELLPLLGEVAANNIPALYTLLDRISVDVEHRGQQVLAASGSPWMACMGFSVSFDWKSTHCYFDEAFEGWGPEDREFALRLCRVHGYNVVLRDDIIVYHVEACSTGRTPFVTLPWEAKEILAYFKNMLHFRDMYPDEDLSHIMRSLLAYSLTPDGGCWRLSDSVPACGCTESIGQRLCEIDKWLRERCLYP